MVNFSNLLLFDPFFFTFLLILTVGASVAFLEWAAVDPAEGARLVNFSNLLLFNPFFFTFLLVLTVGASVGFLDGAAVGPAEGTLGGALDELDGVPI